MSKKRGDKKRNAKKEKNGGEEKKETHGVVGCRHWATFFYLLSLSLSLSLKKDSQKNEERTKTLLTLSGEGGGTKVRGSSSTIGHIKKVFFSLVDIIGFYWVLPGFVASVEGAFGSSSSSFRTLFWMERRGFDTRDETTFRLSSWPTRHVGRLVFWLFLGGDALLCALASDGEKTTRPLEFLRPLNPQFPSRPHPIDPLCRSEFIYDAPSNKSSGMKKKIHG